MERLTVPDMRVNENTTRRTMIDGEAVREHAMEIYWRLKAYEDTGYMPGEIAKLQGDLLQRNAELLKAREKIKNLHNCIGQLDNCVEQLDAINSGLMAANEKLTADYKNMRNELCGRCGSYMNEHNGACDGCRWKQQNAGKPVK